ncbi:hypothetical protein ACQ4PT_037437 [Festuca glaucescens]
MAMAILPFFLLLTLPLAIAQIGRFYGDSGNYTSNSTYQANLRLLSSTLPKKAASNITLFATDTIGDAPDTIFALTRCRRDMNASACEGCVATAFEDGPRLCPYNKDATLFYDACLLSFSNHNFLTSTENSELIAYVNFQNFTTSFDSARLLLFTLLNTTAKLASDITRRFTTSRLDVSSFPTLYCLMQCTPDLTTDDCAICFQDVSRITLKYFVGKIGGQVLGIQCNMRYEIYQFFQGDPMLRMANLSAEVPAINNTTPGSTPVTVYGSPPPPAAAPGPDPVVQTTVEQHGHNSRKRALLIIAVAAPLVSILMCFICSFVWFRRRRKGNTDLHNEAAMNRKKTHWFGDWKRRVQSSLSLSFQKYCRLHATSPKKACLGKVVSAPSTKANYQMELKLQLKGLPHIQDGVSQNSKMKLNLLQNCNTIIVKLMGCCLHGEEKLLVYEYLPNKSLDYFIFDGNRTTLVDWNKRRAIIEGIAKGLLSNDTQGSTKRVVGTDGYMSPEYASEGIYSIKSDVFSFGVLLLEIFSGKKNSSFHQCGDFLNLLGYSWQLWEEGIWIEILEASIAKEIHTTEARRYINMALMCVQESADDRPTMSDVVAMLNSESVVLPEPNHPAYFNLRVSKVHESASVIVLFSNNDVTITAEPDGR